MRWNLKPRSATANQRNNFAQCSIAPPIIPLQWLAMVGMSAMDDDIRQYTVGAINPLYSNHQPTGVWKILLKYPVLFCATFSSVSATLRNMAGKKWNMWMLCGLNWYLQVSPHIAIVGWVADEFSENGSTFLFGSGQECPVLGSL